MIKWGKIKQKFGDIVRALLCIPEKIIQVWMGDSSSDGTDTEIQKSLKYKIKIGFVKRQNWIFIVMISAGSAMLVLSQITYPQLLSEGIAFIIVGCVGLLMSIITSDIGSSIKKAVYDMGKQNEKGLEFLKESQGNMYKFLKESQENMQTTLTEIATSLKNIEESKQETGSSQQETKDKL